MSWQGGVAIMILIVIAAIGGGYVIFKMSQPWREDIARRRKELEERRLRAKEREGGSNDHAI